MSRTAGKTILDLAWERLDDLVDTLMAMEEPEKWVDDRDPDPRNPDHVGHAQEWEEWGRLRGQALGMAEVIALIINAYEPSVDEVRAESLARWQARQ